MKYTKAPVSEVIFGISYNNNVIPLQKLTALVSRLSSTYPLIEVLPPLALEELKDFQLVTELDPSRSGPILFRLRSADRKWVVQLQGDKAYINWVRLDTEPVGYYLGFAKIKAAFDELKIAISSEVGEIPNERISCVDLTYHDRVEWQDYIPDLSKINEILNVCSPPMFSSSGYNNVFSRYSFPDEEIKGYGLININTATAITGKQLLKVEVNLRGFNASIPVDEWLEIAHQKHNHIFDGLFSASIRKRWQ